ncbi:ketosteroid isomerase family protein [Allocoleopsis franciscana]|uniref:NTF2 domain-containing protein n=1 Tax=Allocoleopsis franciscana PCC 7113 TaxID=1173027 RepID=K9WKP8_9CYAN|nr:ketosteroid isomerase family protein [Allocoleopsis franciscana]AFZ20359.1 NTF2 domain-containing protein [Allocoleopsis franciscana PCC 7113]
MTIAEDKSTTTPSATGVDWTIEGIDESVVWRYFQTMNAADYEGTAALFAPTGALHPPFEEPIEGKEAIATYLKAEAKGMQLFPREGIAEALEEDQIQIQVKGKVQTSLFGVNVAWIFILNPEREILYAQIKLLASPQELLNLRR